jgi:hypothetical protein
MTNENVTLSHFQSDDGKRFESITIDGNEFSEKLSGIGFISTIVDGNINVTVRDQDTEVFSTFNENKWITEIKESLLNSMSNNMPIQTNDGLLVMLLDVNTEASESGVSNTAQSTISKLKNLFADDDQTETQIQTENETPVVPNSRLANLLSDMEAEESVAEKADNVFDMMPVEQKIQVLYDKALAKAKAKDADEIISTYVEDMYHPQNSQLAKAGDTANLYFNLLLLTRLQELDIMDFDFDEDINSANNAEYTLAHEFWSDIMNSDMDTASKHVKILDKNFRAMFYTSLFQSMVKNADSATYNNMKRKWSAILSDDDAPTQTLEEGVIEYIRNKTEVGSMVMVTPDITQYFNFDEVNNETLVATDGDGDQQIKFVGTWDDRLVYELNVNKISYLKGFKKGAFFIKQGNKFLINPAKPLGYFHVIDNVFLTKPSLKMYVNLDFKFFNSSSTFLRVSFDE